MDNNSNMKFSAKQIFRKKRSFYEKILYIVYKYGTTGPLIAKCFDLRDNKAVHVSYSQRVQLELIRKDRNQEIKNDYKNSVVGFFVGAKDLTEECVISLEKKDKDDND